MSIPTVLIDTTFSGKDISSAVSVYEYTASANITIRIQVRLAAVAGDGDYTAHITLNDGDAQSDDVIGPRTVYTAESGETAFWFATMNLDLISGDVVNIFVLGQAGDTSESGSIRIFTDDFLQPETAGRKLEVSADGEAGINVDSIVDEVVEGTITLRQAIRIIMSVLFGKSSGGGTSSVAFRDIGDTKNRISATVDGNGNRTSVTPDGT